MNPTKPSKPGKPLKPLKPIKTDNKSTKKSKETNSTLKKSKTILVLDDTDFNNLKYIRHHKPFILKLSSSTIGSIQPGHVIKFSYTSKYSPQYRAFPRPSILVLNPNYQGKMHGLALRFLSAAELRIIKNMVKSKNKLHLKVNMNDPYSFYHNNVKRMLRMLNQNIYRTYMVSNVTRVILISFKFD